MKKNKLIVIIILVIGAVTLSWITFVKKKENRIELASVKPVFGSISKTVMATGTLQPVDTVVVGAQVSGIIKKVYVDFNSVVKKGQLLAELDPVVLQSQQQQMLANLNLAKANLDYQRANYNREQRLFDQAVIAKAEMETATNQYQVAEDNVVSSESQLKAADKNLSFTRIYSPIDGTVLSRNISAGQTVAASFNTPTLFSIANDLTNMQVRASVDEADIGNVKKGEDANFTVDAYPDEIFNGKVEEVRLEPTTSANVVTYTTIIDANNSRLMLKPGMTANINITTQQQDHVILIPLSALHFQPDPALFHHYHLIPLHDSTQSEKNTANVWVQQSDTLIEKQIRTGLSNDINIAVLSGLDPTDMVITAINNRNTTEVTKKPEKSPFMPATRSNNNNRR